MLKLLTTIVIISLLAVSTLAVNANDILSIVDDIINSAGSTLNPSEQRFCDGRISISDISSHVKALINGQTAESQCSPRTNSLCGNGRIDPGEQCDGQSTSDGQIVSNLYCGSFGFAHSLAVRCSSLCTIDTSNCQFELSAVGEQKVLVVPLHFGSPSSNQMFSSIQSVIDKVTSYVSEVSYGRASLQITLLRPTLVSSAGCDANNFDNNVVFLMEKAITSALQSSLTGDLTQYHRIIIITDPYGSDGGGYVCSSPNSGGTFIRDGVHTFIGNTRIYDGDLDATVTFTPYTPPYSATNLLHEFGHSLVHGIHLFNLYCIDEQGNRVAFSNAQNCQGNGRYDWALLDPMSIRFGSENDAFGHYTAQVKEKVKWLLPSQVVVARGGEYALTPLAVNDNGVKLIKIPTSALGKFYYLEFRQPINYDRDVIYPSFYSQEMRVYPSLNGVFIYRDDPIFSGPDLLDPPPYPDPTRFEPGPIPLNQPITLPEGYTIKVTSTSPTQAQVSIRQSQ